MVCPICGADPAVRAFRALPEYRECGRCGFLWRIDKESAARRSRVYSDERVVEGQVRDDARRLAYCRDRVRMMGRWKRPPGKLLEIGCGTGELLRLAAAEGWEVTGIEPSAALCRVARGKVGNDRVVGATMEESELPADGFDCIVAIDVLEHIADAWALATKAYEWLRPGGILALQTPNAWSLRRFLQRSRWNLLAPDRHVLFHTRVSLLHLLGARGFEPLEAVTVSGRGTDRGLVRRLARAYERVLSVHALGSALWVIARKRAGDPEGGGEV